MFWIFFAVLVPSLASLIGTELIRRYALRTSMVDVPNERSSHTVPTPRGGGIALAASVLGSLFVLICLFPEQRSTGIGLLGGGGLIALIGLLDDRFDLSAKSRLLVHFVAAGWFLYWLGVVGVGGAGEMTFGTRFGVTGSLLASVCAVVFLAWCTNVYNFMDGLDGFAGGQALVASTTAALILLTQQDELLAFLMLATAGSAAGFLVWNWPPAKIFMGDCGSGFLGFLFGAVAIAGHRHGTMPLSAGLMLIIVFLGDATLTLLRRVHAGEVWYKPHRTHAYQLATQLGASHLQVTLVSFVAFVIAGSLAFWIAARRDLGSTLVLGYALVIVCVWLLINRLIVGRARALASISNPPLESESDAEVATVVYLRLRHIQTRMMTWRSQMPKNDLLTEVTGVASDLGYTVSHDWLEGCGGGRCEVAGEKWILLDFNMSQQDQVRQILLAIHDEVDSVDDISNNLRTALAKTANKSQVQVGRAA